MRAALRLGAAGRHGVRARIRPNHMRARSVPSETPHRRGTLAGPRERGRAPPHTVTVTGDGLPLATVSYIPGKRLEQGAARIEAGAASFCIFAVVQRAGRAHTSGAGQRRSVSGEGWGALAVPASSWYGTQRGIHGAQGGTESCGSQQAGCRGMASGCQPKKVPSHKPGAGWIKKPLAASGSICICICEAHLCT